MPFISDDQRKAAFARMKGRGGGPRPPGAGRLPRGGKPPSLFDILKDLLGKDPKNFIPKPPGPGIPGVPSGPVTLTGGAIYGTPDSDWFIHQPGEPEFGKLPGYGIGPYDQQWTPEYKPPSTLWGDLYLIMNGIEPSTGNVLHGWGTPGTLKPFPQMSFGYGETWKIELYKNLGKSEGFFGKLTPEGFVPTPPSYLAPNRNEPRPWWAD